MVVVFDIFVDLVFMGTVCVMEFWSLLYLLVPIFLNFVKKKKMVPIYSPYYEKNRSPIWSLLRPPQKSGMTFDDR